MPTSWAAGNRNAQSTSTASFSGVATRVMARTLA
jgi:hypothetical protein